MTTQKHEDFAEALNTDITDMLESISAVHGETYARHVGLMISMLSIIRAQENILERYCAEIPLPIVQMQEFMEERQIRITQTIDSNIHSLAHIIMAADKRFADKRCFQVADMLFADIRMILEKQNEHIARAGK